MGIFKNIQELKKQQDAKVAANSVRMPWTKTCPKCDSTNLKKVKPSILKKWQDASMRVTFFPFSMLRKEAKTMNVCRNCGMQWEDR